MLKLAKLLFFFTEITRHVLLQFIWFNAMRASNSKSALVRVLCLCGGDAINVIQSYCKSILTNVPRLLFYSWHTMTITALPKNSSMNTCRIQYNEHMQNSIVIYSLDSCHSFQKSNNSIFSWGFRLIFEQVSIHTQKIVQVKICSLRTYRGNGNSVACTFLSFSSCRSDWPLTAATYYCRQKVIFLSHSRYNTAAFNPGREPIH